MVVFFQQLIDGISLGAIVATLALAVVMTYRASRMVNFAVGELATLSAFLWWQFMAWGVLSWLAVLLSLAISALLTMGIERILIRPLFAFTSHLPVIVLTLGLLIVVDTVMGATWGYLPKDVPSLFGEGILRIGDVSIPVHSIAVIIVVAVIAVLLGVLLRFTRLGLALRATVDNAQSARLSGVRVGVMLSVGWGLSGLLGAVSGILAAPTLYLQPTMLSTVLLYAFAAAILGGMNSPVGAVVGGVVMGVLENMIGTYVEWIGNDFKQAVALAVIVLVLLIRPQGLFGQKVAVRV